jgi:hypothetical protein
MKARVFLKSLSFQAITELNGPCTKSQISKKVLQIARECDALTDDFIFAFRDIGWRLQDLKKEGLITNNGEESAACRWFLPM